MLIKINKIIRDSLVDGPGVNLVVAFQGCNIGCSGCHNPDAQPLTGGMDMDIRDILDLISPITTGITLSGGEPTLQMDGAKALMKAAKRVGLTTIFYTGLTLKEFFKRYGYEDLLTRIDYLKAEPYVEALRDLALPYRGSSNQVFIKLDEWEVMS